MLTLDNLSTTLDELATQHESPSETAARYGFELDAEAQDFFLGLAQSFALIDPMALVIGTVLGFATAVRVIEEQAETSIAAA